LWLTHKVQAFAAIDSVLQIALLILCVKFHSQNYSIAANALSVAAAFGLLTLVAVEHTRTVRPSTLITTYLIWIITTSNIGNSTLYSQSGASIKSWLRSSSTATNIILLCLEQRPKERIVKLGVGYSPEDISGILGRIVFWWLIPLFQKGYKSIISQDDVFPLDQNLRTETTSRAVAECWEKCQFMLNMTKRTEILMPTR
jgi:ATP-binding cassette subfamily C (CFTR/MRP) protein 1